MKNVTIIIKKVRKLACEPIGDTMDQWEFDFLNFENELLLTRKKLNDLIYEYQNRGQSPQNDAIYQDKLRYLEVELQYINNQMQLLKRSQIESVRTNVQAPVMQNPAMPTPMNAPATPIKSSRTTQDYEKLFGKNLMGIFASVLIFISLIIFATLILPHLTDALKMLAMYIASFAVLSAGLLLYRKNKSNLFYIAIIGCGVGSLYLSLLLSNLYFKVIGDLALYVLILVWAIFVKYLTRIKHYVFTIIGQAGILIASILGTALCVYEADPQRFFVLSIFYFISAVVFSNKSPSSYEHNLCTHIFKTLNVIVYTAGFIFMTDSVYRHAEYSGPLFLIVVNILLFMGYLLLEFFFSYKEDCSGGLAFQVLSMVNAVLLVFLFNEMDLNLFGEDWPFVFMYLVAAAALFYVEKKDAEYKTFSQIWCLAMILIGCCNNPFIKEHLYAYMTVIPFLLIGYFKKDNLYLGAGIVYLAVLPLLALQQSHSGIEHLIVLAIVYVIFLYICHQAGQAWFKIAGYLVLCFAALVLVGDISFWSMKNAMHMDAIQYINTKSQLITFFVLTAIHLVLSRLECFCKEKSTERVMLGINGMLMFSGGIFMDTTDEIWWKLPVILLAVLLFFANSKKLLPRHKYMGYYIALKYSILMLCILGSFDVVDYVVSICLLVFAIISIIAGFYKDMATFRLYGLVLSMISIVKLIMIDIKYDSTIENAISFFVSGVLCFVISFIYNRIDSRFRGK